MSMKPKVVLLEIVTWLEEVYIILYLVCYSESICFLLSQLLPWHGPDPRHRIAHTFKTPPGTLKQKINAAAALFP